ncbi:MAG: site-2 protease family protein [Solirubrobacteraceae bacterium]
MEHTAPPLPEPAPGSRLGAPQKTGIEPEPDHPPTWPTQPSRESFFKRRIAPVGAALVALLTKIKAILLLLGNVKLLVTAGSMLVSVAAYAAIWGVPFAIGFVVLIFVHEMGHVIALRREGIRASAPMFIPFLGAVISARSLGDNAAAEARVGLAGPITGTIGSAVCLIVWQVTGHDFWRALAFTGFLLNLFNLLPVVPLDGGRAMAAMAPWMWFLGFAGMIALLIIFPNPILLIIVVFAAIETYKRWQQRRAGGARQEAYYRVRPRDRWLIAGVYLSLIALLVVGMDATHLARTLG